MDMLIKFGISNFKNFNDYAELNLKSYEGYDYNTEYIVNGYSSIVFIYGDCGSGKSNFCKAIMDIKNNLNEQIMPIDYGLRITEDEINTRFSYQFIFYGQVIEYDYERDYLGRLVYERIQIQNQNLEKNDYAIDKSLLYMFLNNEIDIKETNKNLKKEWIHFLKNMYMPFMNNQENDDMTNSTNVKTMNDKTMNDNIDKTMNDKKMNDKKMNHKKMNYIDKDIINYKIESQELSCLVMDDVDLLGYEQVVTLCKVLLSKQIQGIFSAHRTDLISNDFLRPDCYFSLSNGEMNSFHNKTRKYLRQELNLERLYNQNEF